MQPVILRDGLVVARFIGPHNDTVLVVDAYYPDEEGHKVLKESFIRLLLIVFCKIPLIMHIVICMELIKKIMSTLAIVRS